MSQTKAQLISDLVQALNFTGTASAPANGVFLSAANTLQLSTASTPRLTINSDGHVDVVGNLDVGAGLDVTGNITCENINSDGIIDLEDASSIKLGTDDDFVLSYDNTNNQALIAMAAGKRLKLKCDSLHINNAADNSNILLADDVGAVSLFFGTNARISTTSTGATVTGSLTTTGNITATAGQLTLEDTNEQQILRFWNATSDSDIDGLLTGSTFGTLLEGANNGHHVIALRDNDGSDSVAIISGGGDFQTDNTYDTVIARFMANGNVAIGNHQPASQLHLKRSTGEAILTIESESANDAMVFIDTSDGTGANADVRFARDGSTKGRISFLNAGTGQGDMRFTTGSDAEAFRIHSNGDITVPSGSIKLSESGQGINFHEHGAGSAVSSNILDDYEEGSWTPVLGATSTDPTVSSYSHQIGRYTKIGNVVNLFMFIDISGGNITAAGSGDGTIKGLPFTIGATAGDHNGAAMINFAQLPNSFSTGRNDYRFFFGTGESIMRIHQYNSGNPQVQTGLGSGQIANGNRFKIGLVAVYRTTQ